MDAEKNSEGEDIEKSLNVWKEKTRGAGRVEGRTAK